MIHRWETELLRCWGSDNCTSLQGGFATLLPNSIYPHVWSASSEYPVGWLIRLLSMSHGKGDPRARRIYMQQIQHTPDFGEPLPTGHLAPSALQFESSPDCTPGNRQVSGLFPATLLAETYTLAYSIASTTSAPHFMQFTFAVVLPCLIGVHIRDHVFPSLAWP